MRIASWNVVTYSFNDLQALGEFFCHGMSLDKSSADISDVKNIKKNLEFSAKTGCSFHEILMFVL